VQTVETNINIQLLPEQIMDAIKENARRYSLNLTITDMITIY